MKVGEKMPVSDARKRANAKWDAENLEKVQFDAPKGFNQMIKDRAKELGLSKAGYLKKVITDEIKSAENSHIVIKTHTDEG